MSQKSKKVPESEIPEVVRLLEAKERIDRLKNAHAAVFEQLDELAEQYNTALEAAEKRVRAERVSCGPFDLYQWQTKYDAEKLYEALGHHEFLKVGGVIKTVTQYDVDKARVEAHITSGVIKPEVAEVIKEMSPRFKKPEKISV